MSLKEQLHQDMTNAMKARDLNALGTLRMALAAITNAEVAGDTARELSDDEVIKVLQREVASRKDSAEAYTAGNRPELAAKELSEVEILQRYLPAALTEEEVSQIVDEELARAAESGEAPSMKQMGQIIKAVNARTQGRADGGTVAAMVKQRLLG